VFAGKERQFNRRFLALASHYLFEPVACTPASGWEKGQIENQVGNVREWLFTPTPRFADFAALNAWLATHCQELGERRHPTQDATIAEIFALEQHLPSPPRATTTSKPSCEARFVAPAMSPPSLTGKVANSLTRGASRSRMRSSLAPASFLPADSFGTRASL